MLEEDPRLSADDYYLRSLPRTVRKNPVDDRLAIHSVSPIPGGSEHDILLHTPGGEIRQLTKVGQHGKPLWHPGGDHLLVLSKRSPDRSHSKYAKRTRDREELITVWQYDLQQGGDARQICTELEPVSDFDISPDGSALVVETKEQHSSLNQQSDTRLPPERTPRIRPISDESAASRQLWIVRPETGRVKRLGGAESQPEGSDTWYYGMTPEWGPTGRIVYAGARQDDDTIQIRSTDVAGLDDRVYTDFDALCTQPTFSPDGGSIAFVRRDKRMPGQRSNAFVIDTTTESVTALTSTLDAPIHHLAWVDSETVVLLTVDEGAGRYLLADTTNDEVSPVPRQWPRSPKWSGRSRPFDIDIEMNRLWFPQLAPFSSNICSQRIGNGATDSDIQIIHEFNTELQTSPSPGIRDVSFTNREGESVDAFLLTPSTLEDEGTSSVPMILDIHRDVHAVTAPRFRFKNLFWLARGFAILKVNFTGSSSFGRDFQSIAPRDYLRKSVSDIEDALQAVSGDSDIDSNAMYGVGFRYGASCVVELLATTNILSGGIAMQGIYDYASAYTSSSLRTTLNKRLGEPWRAPDVYDRASPINRAEDIDQPTLIVAGEEDTRAPSDQSARLFAYLSQTETDVTLHSYPQLGSSVYRPPETAIDRLERMEFWLQSKIDRGNADE